MNYHQEHMENSVTPEKLSSVMWAHGTGSYVHCTNQNQNTGFEHKQILQTKNKISISDFITQINICQ